MKKIGAALVLVSVMALPLASSAQVAPLVGTGTSTACYDFKMNLKAGMNSDSPEAKTQILAVQSALINEGLMVPASELGTFGPGTIQAVNSFQEKYADDILAPFALKRGSGYLGAVTRMKLQALYGCRAAAKSSTTWKVELAITNIKLDSDGVTATFCNKGTSDLPTAPFRIRMNGINRDFEIIGAQKAGQCDTETFGYSTWGLTYNQGNTYSAVGLIDPNNFYKTSSISAPLNNTSATLNVPALAGYHLSVRSILPKTSGVQSTLCNLGTQDLTTFPVRVTVNGTSRDLDVAGAYKAGQCATVNWTYDLFGTSYMPNVVYSVTVITDPNNAYKEVNELDNTATIVGMP